MAASRRALPPVIGALPLGAMIGGEAASGGAGIGGAAMIGGRAMEAKEEAALGDKPQDGPVIWGTTANGKS